MKKKNPTDPALDYPGVQTDEADRNKTTPKLTKQETELLNNNPRTQGE